MDEKPDLEFKSTYEWCIRAFTAVRDRLGVNIRLHNDHGQFDDAQVLVFNHFIRFETFIPQYLIYLRNGVKCRCVAAGELFRGNDAFARFLYSVGAVPSDHPGLMPFLAAEIFRGRKIIVFPEGGMVKDRKVIDHRGEFNVYSPSADTRRKHHTGAAVIALTTEIFKQRIRSVAQRGEQDRLERWAHALGLDGIDHMLEIAAAPTMMSTANITFYPLRTGPNFITRLAGMMNREMHPKFLEELIIESNIVLKDTDMDIRLGEMIHPEKHWRWWERLFIARMFANIDSLEDLFALRKDAGKWNEKLFSLCVGRASDRLRDSYMTAIYDAVTVNFNHLASQLVVQLARDGNTSLPVERFNRMLYLTIKYCQNAAGVHLHESLQDPDNYQALMGDDSALLQDFVTQEVNAPYIRRAEGAYLIDPEVLKEPDFHTTRIENQILLHANEVAPISRAVKAVSTAIDAAGHLSSDELGAHWMDEELRHYNSALTEYTKPVHEEINAQETATESGCSFFLEPEKPRQLGIVLVHGLLASPAEMRGYGEHLCAEGYTVMGVRLPGHGTSPWDLKDRCWQEWLDRVRQACRSMSMITGRVALLGFSTGAALALHLAAEEEEDYLSGLVCISTPLEFVDRNLMFVPLVHGMNKLTDWIPSFDGVLPFYPNTPENPSVNYRNIPTRALYELRMLVDRMEKKLDRVTLPSLLVQGTEDPVVVPESAQRLYERLPAVEKRLHWVPSSLHGILYRDIGDTRDVVDAFLAKLDRPPSDRKETSP